MNADPPTTEAVLDTHGATWWRSWDAGALRSVCGQVADEELPGRPDVARWRALATVMQEGGDALGCLEAAHRGHLARDDRDAAALDARIALVLCLIDGGTMGSIEQWLARAADAPEPDPARPTPMFWTHAGAVAMAVFGQGAEAASATAARWLHDQLAPLRPALAPNERLIAAQVLVNRHLATREYGQFDILANAVEEPAAFEAAAPVMRGRWLHTLGLAHYHIGNVDRAEDTWRRTLALAEAHTLPQLRLMTSLAALRLLLDRGRLDEAAQLRATIQPQWGVGRHAQLMYLRQMDARLLVMQGQPVRALESIQDALVLARQLGLGPPGQASCLTDLSQILVANRRVDEAVDLLGRLASEHAGRDGVVFSCLHELLCAWRCRNEDPAVARTLLASALAQAASIRYTMFFRLLPTLAGELCAAALRWDIEPVLVAEIVRARDLPAPADAGPSWPWTVWLRLLGRFDIRLRGAYLSDKPRRKTPRKPIELLQLLGCAPDATLALADAADALWPEADGDLARKSLDMTIQRLRRLLDDDTARLVVVSDGRIALAARHVSSDLAQRRGLIDELERCASAPAGEPERPLALLRSIVELTAGPLLEDVVDADWSAPYRRLARADHDRAARAVHACGRNAGGAAAAAPPTDALLETLRRRSP